MFRLLKGRDNMKRVYRKLSGGLRLIWIGECVAAVGMAAEIITLIWALFEPGIFFLSVAVTLSLLVGFVMGVAGLWKLRREHTAYSNALFALAAILICTLLKSKDAGMLTFVLDFLCTVLGLLELCLVVRATNSFLSGDGREDLWTEGKRALWARIATALMVLVSSILTGLLLDGTARVLTHLAVTEAAMIVSEILYLIYLKHSSEALG